MTLHYLNKNDERKTLIGVVGVKIYSDRGIAEVVLANGKRIGFTLDKIIDVYYR